MFTGKKNYGYKSHARKKKAVYAALTVAALGFAALGIIFAAKTCAVAGGDRKELLRLWDAGDYAGVFDASQMALDSMPTDYFLLTVNGFSAYQLGISQVNSPDSLRYIDESINALRKALLIKNSAKDGRVYYVLGKAYSYKGDSLADLAVEYLEKARSLSYSAADIPEYLGLAYASVGDYRSSVAAFTEALRPPVQGGDANTGSGQNGDVNLPSERKPPDLLLLAIARSYFALGEFDSARAYLLRCIDVSPDSKNIATARLWLGEIFQATGDAKEAESQYRAILAEMGANAEAHYQLGEIYAAQGDIARARAEWRDALRDDPAHTKARTRLSM